MYIIIVGGGSVGYYLCKALLSEGHEVLVLDKDANKCERFEDDMGSVCVRGDGCETATLAAAGASRADLLIATTNEDEDNLVACQVAKHQFGVPRTIARINNPKNEKIFQKLGVDRTISITNLILEHIEGELPTHPLIHLLTMKEEGTEIVEVRVREGSEAVGKPIKKLDLPPDSFLVLLIRNGEKPRVVTEDMVLQANDHVIALTPTTSEDALRQLFTGS
ncbi:MAG: TrkA family potassium uptake protein [Chloroflexi bacterium]|nr:TrkA family potassium uptake protein [Chloroflexota bacterium]MBM3182939.1 TrkA family potassium uptake protein [Chloroflexota bacterium]MBM4451683.1 TrkA family potassium uptake protein [Chloroflexota bacterium]MBM4454581.1 TrkA family potassium uptake protein [Chloroflexota bacterium]